MWRNLKLLPLWRNFRFLHICHAYKSEISPHDRFFSTDITGDIGDKYEQFHNRASSRQVFWNYVRKTDFCLKSLQNRTPHLTFFCFVQHPMNFDFEDVPFSTDLYISALLVSGKREIKCQSLLWWLHIGVPFWYTILIANISDVKKLLTSNILSRNKLAKLINQTVKLDWCASLATQD